MKKSKNNKVFILISLVLFFCLISCKGKKTEEKKTQDLVVNAFINNPFASKAYYRNPNWKKDLLSSEKEYRIDKFLKLKHYIIPINPYSFQVVLFENDSIGFKSSFALMDQLIYSMSSEVEIERQAKDCSTSFKEYYVEFLQSGLSIEKNLNFLVQETGIKNVSTIKKTIITLMLSSGFSDKHKLLSETFDEQVYEAQEICKRTLNNTEQERALKNISELKLEVEKANVVAFKNGIAFFKFVIDIENAFPVSVEYVNSEFVFPLEW